MTLDPKRLGLGFAIAWALLLTIVAVLGIAIDGYAPQFFSLMGEVYPGFAATPGGVIAGIGWALIDGFLIGFVIAWIYNKLG